ncbi:MAG: hypothetical protein GYB37_07030 [Algicola sp.]|nr:hypothetical protein [Algicola sp.]
MKKLIYLKIMALIVLGLYISCNEDDSERTGEILLTSQTEVDNWVPMERVEILSLRGEDIVDLSNLDVRHVKSLTIEGTGLKALNFASLVSVGMMEVRNNPQLTSLSLDKLRFITGNVIIENNEMLGYIYSLSRLKFIEGNISFINNQMLGEDFPCPDEEVGAGFCLIKRMYEEGIIEGNVILQNNHPDSANDLAMIGQVGMEEGYLDYNLRSQSEVNAFAPARDTINNLTINGVDIDYIGSIKDKISTVLGVLTIENTSVGTTEQFFEFIKANGSIVIRNNPLLNNPNGFRNTEVVYGDLIVENNPNLPFDWAPDAFSKIDSIHGSLKIKDNPLFGSGGVGLQNLVYVQGDFEISGAGNNLWNLGTMNGIQHIGGNLVISNNEVMNSLNGLQHLEFFGGDSITITDNGGIADANTDNGPGFCLLREMMEGENPIISSGTTIILKRTGEPDNIEIQELNCN